MKKTNFFFLVLYVYSHVANCSVVTQLATTIDPSTGGTITASGSYYLGWDVSDTITISGSNIILDLNGRQTKQISISGGSARVQIKNGFIGAVGTGVTVASGATDIYLHDLNIFSVTNGVEVDTVMRLFISKVVIQDIAQNGDGICMNGCANCIIRDSVFANGGSNSKGILMDTSEDVEINNCTFHEFGIALSFGSNQAGEVRVIDSSSFNCSFNAGKNMKFIRCIAEQGGFSASGTTDSPTLIYIDCIANGSNGDGFSFRSVDDAAQGTILLVRCLSFNHVGDGFLVENLGTTATYIGAFKECIAYKNGGTGFNDVQGIILLRYHANYAYDNALLDYSPLITFSPVTVLDPSGATYWRNITGVTT